MSASTDRLDRMISGTHLPSPCGVSMSLPVVQGYEPGRIWYDWDVDPRFINSFGSLFGGYTSALLDDAATHATFSVLPDDRGCVTSDLRISLFRPAFAGETLHMEAVVINQSRSSHHVECTLTRKQDGKMIAKATAIVSLFAKAG